MADKNHTTFENRAMQIPGVFISTPTTRGETIKIEGKFEKFWAKIRGPKKYLYLGVCFWADNKVYYYRTEDRHIGVGKVVMVPVSYGPDRPAEVVSAKWYSEGYAPYPLKWTPMISGPAAFRDQIKFDWARMKRDARAYRVERREKRRERKVRRGGGWLTAMILMDIFFDD